jgi:PKD repeat protein
MKNNLLLVIFIIGANFYSYAQQEGVLPCGTDEMHQRLFVEFPSYNEGIVNAHNELQSFTHNYTPTSRANDPYIIPVVFHIIHNYGAENISDAQILDAVKQVNIQLRKKNADTTDIVGAFQNIAADTEIEIRLAQLDPNGNCTSGITRNVSTTTLTGDHQVKDIIHWPPDKYLNIYVCNQAAGLAGHALLPSAADTIPQWDGIVMQHSYIGTVGTSDFFRRTVLTHEIGHYLNLQHIWGGNNVPNYYYLPVAQGVNCDYDDDVADTPNTVGWQTCNTGGVSCGTLDNVQNYMDYAYCARMFTEGQKQRMHACLNSPIANRNNLWSLSNLAATGTDGLVNYLCAANFSSDKRIVCVGEEIELSDISYHGVSSRLWDLPGATVSSLTDSTIIVSYALPGKYSVGLIASNGVNEVAIIEQEFITVLPSTGTIDFIIESFENLVTFDQKWVVSPNLSPVNWNITNETGNNSNQSIFVRNYEGPSGVEYIFQSEPIDASGLTDIAIAFDYASSRFTSSNLDWLQVQISNDCGENWLTRRTISTTNLMTTADFVQDDFYPNLDEWKSAIVDNISAAYLVDNFMVRFVFKSAGGNNVFIDNVNVSHPDVLALKKNTLENKFRIYPNPTADKLTIQNLSGSVRCDIKLVDPLGKVILSQSENDAEVILNLSVFSSGVYQLILSNGEISQTQKLIIQ